MATTTATFLRGLAAPCIRTPFPSPSPIRVPTITESKTRVPATPNTTSRSMEAAATTADASTPKESDSLVQYVVLRRDLIEQWPLGSVVAQGCHASVAAIWSYRDHPDTVAYCSHSNLDTMRKVTLEVKGEEQMRSLSRKLTAGGIEHKMWIEQPEDMPTCISTRPCRRSEVAPFFKKLKLCK